MKRFLNPADDELKVLPLRVCDGSPYPLSRTNIDKLISLSHIEEYSNGELIMKAGEIFTCLAIVISGITRVWHNEGNRVKTLYFGLEGTVCMSMHGYMYDFPATENREACGPVRMLVINRDDLNRFMAANAEVYKWFLGRLMIQLYCFENKNKILRGSAEEQYRAIVEHRPDIANKVPLKHIASYIGITPLHLSRIRGRKK